MLSGYLLVTKLFRNTSEDVRNNCAACAIRFKRYLAMQRSAARNVKTSYALKGRGGTRHERDSLSQAGAEHHRSVIDLRRRRLKSGRRKMRALLPARYVGLRAL